MSWVLTQLYHAISGVPFLEAIGAYGVAIIVMTILIKLVLWPIYHFQLSTSKKAMQAQRAVAPELAELRKKYKGDSQKLQTEMMALYKERGVNPLGGAIGCLPALVQMPILSALYYVFQNTSRTGHFTSLHFLFVPNLSDYPNHHTLLPGLPVPAIAYLIIPLLAALTTFVQSRMIQQPPNPYASEQEQQTQQAAQSMQVMMPLMIGFFAISTPAGLGLYWFVSNCVAIIQQYFVTGWGQLRIPFLLPGPSKPDAQSRKEAQRPSSNGSSKPAASARIAPVAKRQSPSKPKRARK